MTGVVLLLALCLTSAQLAFGETHECLEEVFQTPKLRSYVIEATKNLTRDILKTYLFANEDALGRFGGKLELLAEKLLEKELSLFDKKMIEDNLLRTTESNARRLSGSCSHEAALFASPQNTTTPEATTLQEESKTQSSCSHRKDLQSRSTFDLTTPAPSQDYTEPSLEQIEETQSTILTTEPAEVPSTMEEVNPTKQCKASKAGIRKSKRTKKAIQMFLSNSEDGARVFSKTRQIEPSEKRIKFDMMKTFQDLGTELLKTMTVLEPKVRSPRGEQLNSTLT